MILFLSTGSDGFKDLPELVFPVHLPRQLAIAPEQSEVRLYKAAVHLDPLLYADKGEGGGN